MTPDELTVVEEAINQGCSQNCHPQVSSHETVVEVEGLAGMAAQATVVSIIHDDHCALAPSIEAAVSGVE